MNKSELLNDIVNSCEFKEWLEYQLTYDDFLYSVATNCFFCSGFNSDIIDYLECELDSEQAYDDALDVVDDILREFSVTDLQHFLNELHDEYHLSALDLSKYAKYFDGMFSRLLVDCIQDNESKLVDHFTCYIDSYVDECFNPDDMCGPQRRAWEQLRRELICEFESDIQNIGSYVNYELVQLLNSTDGDHYDDACYYFDNVYTKIYDELV